MWKGFVCILALEHLQYFLLTFSIISQNFEGRNKNDI